jgi:hypothetical protein
MMSSGGKSSDIWFLQLYGQSLLTFVPSNQVIKLQRNGVGFAHYGGGDWERYAPKSFTAGRFSRFAGGFGGAGHGGGEAATGTSL